MNASPHLISTMLCSRCHSSIHRPRSFEPLTESLSKLRSGFIPPKSDRWNIWTQIQDAMKALSLYETEISKTTAILENLQIEHRALLEFTETQKSLVAPIRFLPVEILAEIMLKVAEGSTSDVRQRAVLNLSHVSHMWRHVAAHHCKGMWASIRVDVASTFSPSTERLVNLFLDRSDPLPINVDIRAPYSHGLGPTVLRANPVLKELAKHAARWISLRMPATLTANQAFKGISLPQLKATKIDRDYRDINLPGMQLSLGFFESCPSLEDAYLSTPFISSFNFPWAQLKHLTVSACTVNALLGVLEETESLEVLTVMWLDWEALDASFPVRYITSNVKTLELILAGDDDDRSGWMLPLFNTLVLPSLTTLVVQTAYNGIPMIWSHVHASFIGMLERTNGALEDMTMLNIRIAPEELASCWALTPKLRKLDLVESIDFDEQNPQMYTCRPIVTDELLRKLVRPHAMLKSENVGTAAQSEPSYLLPNLKCLELSGELGFGHEAFVEVIESRLHPNHMDDAKEGPAVLEKLSLDFVNTSKTAKSKSYRVLRRLLHPFWDRCSIYIGLGFVTPNS